MKFRSTYTREEVEDGDFVLFVAGLPEGLRNKSCEADHFHLWKRSQEKARIAHNLETRRQEIENIFERLHNELDEACLDFADIQAFERLTTDKPVFPFTEEYIMPRGYDRWGYKENKA
ncbi:hypothetical protein IAD21_00878 [Abditibacteriota bacterium]|nr:hypothetical protein IAD21_00878 [Abditibacteriota bacterium]